MAQIDGATDFVCGKRMSRRFITIAGPANSGKMPLARKLMQGDADLILVHRDFLRASFEAQVDEAHITLLMGDLVRGILRIDRSPIVVAWNLEQSDARLWLEVAREFGVALEWLDVRQPRVAAMIPPLEVSE